jgi:hypothetical protein
MIRKRSRGSEGLDERRLQEPNKQAQAYVNSLSESGVSFIVVRGTVGKGEHWWLCGSQERRPPVDVSKLCWLSVSSLSLSPSLVSSGTVVMATQRGSDCGGREEQCEGERMRANDKWVFKVRPAWPACVAISARRVRVNHSKSNHNR